MVGMSDYEMLVECVLWLFNNRSIEFQISDDPLRYYSNTYAKGTVTLGNIMEYVSKAMEDK